MDKKRVLVDVDNVSLEFCDPYLRFMNEVYGQNIRQEEIRDARVWDFPNRNGLANKYRLLRFLFWSDFLDLSPVEGAAEGINELRKDYDVLFGTSRTKFVQSATLKSMEKYFGDVEVQARYHFYWRADADIKVSIAKKKRVDFVVEDDPWVAVKLGMEKISGVLFSRSYNRSYDLSAIGWYRAKNWEGVKECLDKLVRGEHPLYG